MLRPDPAALVDQLCELGETDFWIKSVDAARGHVDIVWRTAATALLSVDSVQPAEVFKRPATG